MGGLAEALIVVACEAPGVYLVATRHAHVDFADRNAWNAHLETLGISSLKVNPDPVMVGQTASPSRALTPSHACPKSSSPEPKAAFGMLVQASNHMGGQGAFTHVGERRRSRRAAAQES
jgi:hypothetical protein